MEDPTTAHKKKKKKKKKKGWVLNTHQAAFGYTMKLRGPVIF